MPTFDIVDHWYCYEWQHCGSGHVHGFLWLGDGPDIDEKDLNNEVHRQELVDYFADKVFAHTPLQNHPRPAVNPCQVASPVNKPNQHALAELLNRVQRHSQCIASYCL